MSEPHGRKQGNEYSEATEGNELTLPGGWEAPRQPSQGDRHRSSQPNHDSSPKPYKSTTIPAIKTEDLLEGERFDHLLV